MTFPEFQQRLAPPALAGPWGVRWWASMGAGKEDAADAASDAVTAGFVLEAPTDALARHGADVVLERLPGEPLEEFRARIHSAWETWKWAASKKGVLLALGELGYGGVIVANGEWSPEPPDGRTGDWSRCWVYLLDHPFTIPKWGASSVWGAPGRYWGSSASPEDLEVIRRVLRKWIGARDRVVSVNVVFGRVWGAAGGPWGVGSWGTGVWGASGWGSGVWGGAVVSYTNGNVWGRGLWGDIRRFPIWGRSFFV